MELKWMCHRPLCSADECTCSPCHAVANKTCFCRWSALGCRSNITFGPMHASALYECMNCNHLSKSMNGAAKATIRRSIVFRIEWKKARRMHIECPIVWFNSSIDLLVPVGDYSIPPQTQQQSVVAMAAAMESNKIRFNSAARRNQEHTSAADLISLNLFVFVHESGRNRSFFDKWMIFLEFYFRSVAECRYKWSDWCEEECSRVSCRLWHP